MRAIRMAFLILAVSLPLLAQSPGVPAPQAGGEPSPSPEAQKHPDVDSSKFVVPAETTIPLVLVTVWRMLVTRANIRAGDFVLIWGGAGGLGVMAPGTVRPRRIARQVLHPGGAVRPAAHQEQPAADDLPRRGIDVGALAAAHRPGAVAATLNSIFVFVIE